MKWWSLILAGTFVASSFYAWSEELIPIEFVTEIREDEDGHKILSAQVVYQAGCYQPHTQSALVKEKAGVIELFHKASRTAQSCSMKLHSHPIDFELGPLPDGDYVVVDGLTKTPLVHFSVTKNEEQ